MKPCLENVLALAVIAWFCAFVYLIATAPQPTMQGTVSREVAK
jgi:hypothetical protein